jgi:hypothetical protein
MRANPQWRRASGVPVPGAGRLRSGWRWARHIAPTQGHSRRARSSAPTVYAAWAASSTVPQMEGTSSHTGLAAGATDGRAFQPKWEIQRAFPPSPWASMTSRTRTAREKFSTPSPTRRSSGPVSNP